MGRTKKANFAEPILESAAEPAETVALKAESISKAEGIAHLDLDLGRQDLNQMVGKINELVAKLNETK